MRLAELKIAIIGLGYVGLPLAVEFGKKVSVVGFDISSKRIGELKNGQDHTLEVSPNELQQASQLTFTCDLEKLKECNFSTVYPGATEEVCIPVLEKVSGLEFNTDFFAGYSPERINPGDKLHRVTNILKITSGSTPEVAEFIDEIYNLIIEAGTHKASTIKVAEAAKVIENTQRDVNIALINELALIFNRMGIDTEDVLKAAGTKWNFLPFRPGLVGGHCIGVDPYYLTHKAQSLGLHPEIILAARRLNDRMGEYVATQLIKEMVKQRIQVVGSKVLVMGLSFKENCPDIRNTKIIDMVKALKEYELDLDIYDPWADSREVEHEYGLTPITQLQNNHYDAVILAVAHDEFKNMSLVDFKELLKENYVLYDLKYILDVQDSDLRL